MARIVVRFLGCILLLVAIAAVALWGFVQVGNTQAAQARQSTLMSVAHHSGATYHQRHTKRTQRKPCPSRQHASHTTPTATPATPTPTGVSRTGNGGTSTATPSPVASTPTPATMTPTTTVEAQAAQAVFAQINQERAGAGLPALTWSTQLVQSAHAHNLAMAAANNLSHQLPDEAGLGTRVQQTGLSWTSVAENIGEGDGQSAQSMAVTLNQDMFNEKAPDDGHRRNILSNNTLIGVDVVVDSKGQVWLTEDFAKPGN